MIPLSTRACSRAAAVELPEEQREGDVVRDPDDRTGPQERTGRVRFRTTLDEMGDQEGRRPQRAEHEEGHEADRKRPEPSREACDLGRLADEEGEQQQPFDQGRSQLGPGRSWSGSRNVSVIAAMTAPAIGQRDSATARSELASPVLRGVLTIWSRAAELR